MSQLRTSRAGRLSALGLTSLLGLAMTMMLGGFASTASAAEPVVVAQNAAATMKSNIKGATADGRVVSGSFTPLHFSKKNGRLLVRGLINGVVENPGTDRTFSAMRTFKVKRINGEPARARAAQLAVCQILNLVLGPLDLNLLGLRIQLNRVVLNITAITGSLLGDLLCAVAGLLSGGPLGGLLGQLSDLLNRILARLGLGL